MAQVGIIMGSQSDLPIMEEAIAVLKEFNIETEVDIVSAHRTPEKMMSYGSEAHKRGLKVIIAGAGGAPKYTRICMCTFRHQCRQLFLRFVHGEPEQG